MDGVIGEIRLFAVDFAPRNWAFCQGQTLSIAQNQALFSILGTTYGGDGITTFKLPDLRGRVPVGAPPRGSFTLGQQGGVETNVMGINTMPSHTHAASGTVKFGAKSGKGSYGDSPSKNFYAQVGTGVNNYGTTNDAVMGSSSVNVTVNNTGANAPINNMQPYTCLNYIICLNGIFPDRN